MHDMWILLRRPLRGLATAREVHRRGRQSEQGDDLCTDVAYRYRARLIEARRSRLCHARLNRPRKKAEKQVPRGLKPARDGKNKRLRRWPEGQLYHCEGVPFQNAAHKRIVSSLSSRISSALTPRSSHVSN